MIIDIFITSGHKIKQEPTYVNKRVFIQNIAESIKRCKKHIAAVVSR